MVNSIGEKGMRFHVFLKISLAGLLLATWSGCVGYRLGSSLPSDIKSIYIPLFSNKSNEPLIENEATARAIAQFQQDGTLKIARTEDADIILACTLNSVTMEPLRYNRTGDRVKPNEYRLTLHCTYILKRAASRKVMSEGDVIGEATFVYAGSLNTAKRDTVPLAAEDLARRLVEKVVEVW